MTSPQTRPGPGSVHDAPAYEAPLIRRLLAEALGTGLLVTVVIGSGAAAQRLSPNDVGLQLLENSTATVLGLGVLILIFAPVSGAHFNPVVSGADWWLGRPDDRSAGEGLPGRLVGLFALAQTAGGIAGAALGNAMFDVPSGFSTRDRDGWRLWLAELIATAVLVLLIHALTRTGRRAYLPAAVGAYIGAAYWFTASTSFANPAVTVARAFSDSFAGIAPASVPGFIAAQLLGGCLGVLLVRALYPLPSPRPEGVDMTAAEDRRPSILFACRANAGRSVTARVLTKHYAGGDVEAHSAGSAPGATIHPEVAAVLTGLGLDVSEETPTAFDPDGHYSVVITMGCGDTCPHYAGAGYQDWAVADPKGQDLQTVTAIVADIDTRVRTLLRRLVPDLQLPPAVTRTDATT